MSNTKGKEKEKPLASLLAGATAGGIEAFVTYPFESLKTQLQFGALNGEKVRPPLFSYSLLSSIYVGLPDRE